MLAVGMCVAGRFDGTSYERRDPDAATFYVELAPISDVCDSEALGVARLDRESLKVDGVAPAEAMRNATEWIRAVSGADRPVICSYPAGFDWVFFYWYRQTFIPDDATVEFSSCMDMKTMLATRGRRMFSESGHDDIPEALRSARSHTHNALDDAKEQAELFSNLFTWAGASPPN